MAPRIYSVCTCHASAFDDIPDARVTIDIGSCGRVCIFCGKDFSKATAVRGHCKGCKKRPSSITMGEGSKGRLNSHSWSLTDELANQFPPTLLSSSNQSFSHPFPFKVRDLPLLSAVDDSTRQLWESAVGSLPTLVAPSSCFSPGIPSLLEAFTAVAEAAPTGEYNIYADGRSVDSSLSNADRSKLCLETLFYARGHEPPNRELKVFDIYNHGLPHLMRVPTDFNATALESMSAFSMLVTPPGTYSDLHHDRGFLQVIHCFGMKEWVVYPGTVPNSQVHVHQSIHQEILSNDLEGGIRVEPGDMTLVLPPGTLHAVKTRKGAILIGAEIAVIGSLRVMAHLIRPQLEVFETSKTSVGKDIESYAEVVRLTLGLRREDSTLRALESWLYLLPTLLITLNRLPSSDFLSMLKDLIRELKNWSGKDTSYMTHCACQPGVMIGGVGAHFRQEHLDCVLNRTKKNGRK